METEALALPDKRNLKALTRNERRAYFKSLENMSIEQRRATVINLGREVEALDADGTVIKNKEGKVPTLKEISLFSLRAVHNTDQNQGPKEKMERYSLIKRIEPVEEIELNESEGKLLKDRVAKMYLNVPIIGRSWELIDGKD